MIFILVLVTKPLKTSHDNNSPVLKFQVFFFFTICVIISYSPNFTTKIPIAHNE